jgi:hypothetical protein
LKPEYPCLVECKYNRQDFSLREEEQLRELGKKTGVRCFLAYNDHGEIRYQLIFQPKR